MKCLFQLNFSYMRENIYFLFLHRCKLWERVPAELLIFKRNKNMLNTEMFVENVSF